MAFSRNIFPLHLFCCAREAVQCGEPLGSAVCSFYRDSKRVSLVSSTSSASASGRHRQAFPLGRERRAALQDRASSPACSQVIRHPVARRAVETETSTEHKVWPYVETVNAMCEVCSVSLTLQAPYKEKKKSKGKRGDRFLWEPAARCPQKDRPGERNQNGNLAKRRHINLNHPAKRAVATPRAHVQQLT